jgi:RND family efflux transporter MFP subunit
MVRPTPILAAVALLASAPGCRRDPAAAGAPTPATPPAAAPSVASRLVDPEPVRFAPRITATGTLRARQSSPLATAVPGILLRIAVERGQEVKAGALLAALDADAAQAAAAQAEAGLAAARAQLALAQDGLDRVTRLRQEEGATEAQAVQARAQRDLAAAQAAGAVAQLRQAQVNLAHHQLRAPFDGVVTRIPDGTGIMVGAGTPLVTLLANRELFLETSLTQEEAAELRPGAPVTVHVPATGARTEAAHLDVVVPAVDTQTNRVPVEVAVPNEDGRFLPNASARAELPRGEARDAWRVPASAMVQRQGGFSLWVAGPDGKAQALPVRLLAEEGDAAVVTAAGGWAPGAPRRADDALGRRHPQAGLHGHDVGDPDRARVPRVPAAGHRSLP